MRRLSTLAALVVLGAALIVSAAGAAPSDGQTTKTDLNGQITKVGGVMDSHEVVQAHFTSDSLLKVSATDASRDRDYSVPITVVTGLTLVGGNYYMSQFVTVPEYSSFEVHCAWADSSVAATADSVGFEIFPVGKTSTTPDGQDYLIDTDPTNNQLDGFLIRPLAAGGLWSNTSLSSGLSSMVFYRGRSAASMGAGLSSGTALSRPYVSFPLALKTGAQVRERILGFYIVNRSSGANALTNLRQLTIELWPKVN